CERRHSGAEPLSTDGCAPEFIGIEGQKRLLDVYHIPGRTRVIFEGYEISEIEIHSLLRMCRPRQQQDGREDQHGAGHSSLQHGVSPKLETSSLRSETAGVMPPTTLHLTCDF